MPYFVYLAIKWGLRYDKFGHRRSIERSINRSHVGHFVRMLRIILGFNLDSELIMRAAARLTKYRLLLTFFLNMRTLQIKLNIDYTFSTGFAGARECVLVLYH